MLHFKCSFNSERGVETMGYDMKIVEKLMKEIEATQISSQFKIKESSFHPKTSGSLTEKKRYFYKSDAYCSFFSR
jgi:hypothetical protein